MTATPAHHKVQGQSELTKVRRGRRRINQVSLIRGGVKKSVSNVNLCV